VKAAKVVPGVGKDEPDDGRSGLVDDAVTHTESGRKGGGIMQRYFAIGFVDNEVLEKDIESVRGPAVSDLDARHS
jgi:hypothetical protein